MTELPIKLRPTKDIESLRDSIKVTLEQEGYNRELKEVLEDCLDELWVRKNIEGVTGLTWAEFQLVLDTA